MCVCACVRACYRDGVFTLLCPSSVHCSHHPGKDGFGVSARCCSASGLLHQAVVSEGGRWGRMEGEWGGEGKERDGV